MKNRSPILMGALAILVGSAMLVSAVVLSNVLTYTNQVQGITLTSTWTDEARTLGQEYDFTVTYGCPSGAPSAVIMFEFSRTGIGLADIKLQASADGTTWENVVFDWGVTNTIVGATLAIQVGQIGSTFDYKLTYNVAGTYVMTIWAE